MLPYRNATSESIQCAKKQIPISDQPKSATFGLSKAFVPFLRLALLRFLLYCLPMAIHHPVMRSGHMDLVFNGRAGFHTS